MVSDKDKRFCGLSYSKSMGNTRKFAILVLLVLALVATCLPGRSYADVNDFTIESFEADYYLMRDEGGRSQMRVVEAIVAEFPAYDQNHGIERAIPHMYDGHSVNLAIMSVKNGVGKAWQYTTYNSNDNQVLRIGDSDRYVHGRQTYVIEYMLRDVTKNFVGNDELYWDVNGTDWNQNFGSVTARLHIPKALQQAYTGETRCFSGRQGETDTCSITESGTATGETILLFSPERTLYARENMTFVVGFEQGTFVPYEPTWWERYLPALITIWLALGGVILLVMIGVLVHASRRYGRSPEGKGTIVPQYLPPKDINVLIAANILGKPSHAVTAQLIDLAVRHYLKIYEVETKGSWFRKGRTYELEITKSPQTLRHEELRLVHIVFGDHVRIGDRVTVELLRSKLYTQSIALQKEVTRKAEVDGYFTDRAHQRKRFRVLAGLLLAGGVLLLLPGAAVAGIITFIVVASWRPFTEKGVAQRDYLKGLRMYMKLAEADRLRQLQSPEGAAKTSVDTQDKKQLVKLYERLLPYAILFGIEKEWVKELAPLYEQPPDWYSGNWAAFHGAAFASSIGGFTSASNSAFSSPSSSSSSGFSGGGSSGGGGGGGGGGGW